MILDPNGRLEVKIETQGVEFHRRLGRIGDGHLRLTRGEFYALQVACCDWRRRRHRWAAYWSELVHVPDGAGGAWYYRKPGRNSRKRRIGSEIRGTLEGRRFRANDKFLAVEVAEHNLIVADIRRSGEIVGCRVGEPIGVVYRLGPEALLLARREDADLVKGGKSIGWEPEDQERIRG